MSNTPATYLRNQAHVSWSCQWLPSVRGFLFQALSLQRFEPNAFPEVQLERKDSPCESTANPTWWPFGTPGLTVRWSGSLRCMAQFREWDFKLFGKTVLVANKQSVLSLAGSEMRFKVLKGWPFMSRSCLSSEFPQQGRRCPGSIRFHTQPSPLLF